MFTGLRLQNFKSWRDTGEIRFAPLTGFFGTNSSGKSSLLQVLLLWKQTVENSDFNKVLNINGFYVKFNSFDDFIFQHDTSLDLTTQLGCLQKWEGVQSQITFKSIIGMYEQQLLSKQINYSWQKPYPNSIALTFSQSEKIYLLQKFNDIKDPINVEFEDKKRNIKPIKGYGLPNFDIYFEPLFMNISTLNIIFEALLKNTYYLGPLRQKPARFYSWSGEEPQDVGIEGENTVPALMISQIQPERKHVQEKVAYWLKELGLIDRFELKPIAPGRREYEILVQINPESTPVPLTDVGFGVSQILPVLTLCYYVPEESTLILEQPEIHLHPAVQSGLADVFIDVIKNRRLQIILESHSEHLLRRLQRRMAEEKLLPEETALYFTYMEQGESHLEPLEIDAYGNIHNWPKNFFGNELDEMGAMMEAALKRQIKQNGG